MAAPPTAHRGSKIGIPTALNLAPKAPGAEMLEKKAALFGALGAEAGGGELAEL